MTFGEARATGADPSSLVELGVTENPKSALQCAAQWVKEGQSVVCATVIATWRSSPRPVGSQMVVAQDGRFAGSVSGGCVESAVIQAAMEITKGGQPRSMSFGVTREQAWSVGLPCGGKIEVFLASLSADIASTCEEARSTRTGLVLLTNLASGQTQVWLPRGDDSGSGEIVQAVEGEVRRGRSGVIEVREQRWFVHLLSAPLRLLIVGAAHLSQALASLAQCAGYRVTVIDPRSAFASPERFAGVDLFDSWPDEALEQLQPDVKTAIVVLSHDEKLDDPALVAALTSPCFYIGALGSKKTQAARRKRLSVAGFDETSLARIHGPVGLAIGARTPHEIAVAILAEIIQVQHEGRRQVPPGVWQPTDGAPTVR